MNGLNGKAVMTDLRIPRGGKGMFYVWNSFWIDLPCQLEKAPCVNYVTVDLHCARVMPVMRPADKHASLQDGQLGLGWAAFIKKSVVAFDRHLDKHSHGEKF